MVFYSVSFNSFFGENVDNNKMIKREVNGHLSDVLKGNSTRHKSQNGETHKGIVGDLEGINKPKSKDTTLKELKENTINNVELGLDVVEILGVTLCDNKKYIYELLERKISEKKGAQRFNKNSSEAQPLEIGNQISAEKAEKEENNNSLLFPKGSAIHKQKEDIKDDIITNPSRGEKETMEYLQGIKESNGKTDYGELDWDYIDLMAFRMSKNLEKYPPKNWQKKLEIEELAKSAIRHARKILQKINNDEETLQEHATALGCNGMMINFQLKTINERAK